MLTNLNSRYNQFKVAQKHGSNLTRHKLGSNAYWRAGLQTHELVSLFSFQIPVYLFEQPNVAPRNKKQRQFAALNIITLSFLLRTALFYSYT